ncbi:hypothetical protein AB6O49_22265 [Streptomyces sp. SBR177]
MARGGTVLLLAAPRAAAGRLALPARRPARSRFAALPLVAADVPAVLLAVGVLTAAHRRWELALPVVALVVLLDARAGLHRRRRCPSGSSTTCRRWPPGPGSPGA